MKYCDDRERFVQCPGAEAVVWVGSLAEDISCVKYQKLSHPIDNVNDEASDHSADCKSMARLRPLVTTRQLHIYVITTHRSIFQFAAFRIYG